MPDKEITEIDTVTVNPETIVREVLDESPSGTKAVQAFLDILDNIERLKANEEVYKAENEKLRTAIADAIFENKELRKTLGGRIPDVIIKEKIVETTPDVIPEPEKPLTDEDILEMIKE